jgi:hypothetical protein
VNWRDGAGDAGRKPAAALRAHLAASLQLRRFAEISLRYFP